MKLENKQRGQLVTLVQTDALSRDWILASPPSPAACAVSLAMKAEPTKEGVSLVAIAREITEFIASGGSFTPKTFIDPPLNAPCVPPEGPPEHPTETRCLPTTETLILREARSRQATTIIRMRSELDARKVVIDKQDKLLEDFMNSPAVEAMKKFHAEILKNKNDHATMLEQTNLELQGDLRSARSELKSSNKRFAELFLKNEDLESKTGHLEGDVHSYKIEIGKLNKAIEVLSKANDGFAGQEEKVLKFNSKMATDIVRIKEEFNKVTENFIGSEKEVRRLADDNKSIRRDLADSDLMNRELKRESEAIEKKVEFYRENGSIERSENLNSWAYYTRQLLAALEKSNKVIEEHAPAINAMREKVISEIDWVNDEAPDLIGPIQIPKKPDKLVSSRV